MLKENMQIPRNKTSGLDLNQDLLAAKQHCYQLHHSAAPSDYIYLKLYFFLPFKLLENLLYKENKSRKS